MNNTPSSIASDLLAGRSRTGDTCKSIQARQALVTAALSQLPPFERDVLRLFYSKGYTYEQIAEKVGCDEITARRTRDRAFHQFIGVLRKNHWIKMSGVDWKFDARDAIPEVKSSKPTAPRPPDVNPMPEPSSTPLPVAPVQPPPVKPKLWPLPVWPRDVREALEICKVSPSAGFQEKRSAYRRLVKQYHPDVVSHLGTDFIRLAEESTKRINRAWEMISADGR